MVTELSPLKIVYVTSWFGSRKFKADEDIGHDCPIPEGYSVNLTHYNASSWCTATSSTDDMDSAAGLIYHAVDTAMDDGVSQRTKNQPRILESLEAPFSSPFRSDKESMKRFDYLASYNFKSTFLFTYLSPAIMDVVDRPLPKEFMKTKRKNAPILWIAKNCRATNRRELYIEKLMEYIDVHSYGECLNNRPFPKDKSRMELISEYKFYLAVENSNCDDYVTEKLADTISMSAVPIADGPSSYEGFIPTNRSIIRMDAYPDPKDLADYINYLNSNDTAYLEYLSFRRDALDIAPKDRLEPAFIDLWGDTIEHNKRSSYCSVCRGLIPWWEARTKGLDYVEKEDVFLADTSCSPAGKWTYVVDGPPYNPTWTPSPRDEFTRPDFYDTIPANNSDSILPEEVDSKTDSVLIANISFALLFGIFIVFLRRESKKLRNTHNELV